MVKIVIIQDPLTNKLIGNVDSIERSVDLFNNQKNIVASFDVSDLFLHAVQL